MLLDWGHTTLFTHGHQLNSDDIKILRKYHVDIDYRVIKQITGHADIELEDNPLAKLDGLFVVSTTHIREEWIKNLGVEIETRPMGEIIKTNAMKETSIPNVFAAGDVARFGGSVTFAVSDGNFAGVATHHSLIFEQT